MSKVTTDFAIEYLLDDCDDCLEKTDDNECISQSHCFEVKRMAIQALKQMDALDKIKAEIEQRSFGIANDSVIQGMIYEREDILKIIDKYRKGDKE